MKTKTHKINPGKIEKVLKSKQNKGGYYKGMPGVSLDEKGNRKFITFLMTEEGYATSSIFAHPKLVKDAIEAACLNNRHISSIVRSASYDVLLKKRGIIPALTRMALIIAKRKAESKLYRNAKNNA